MNTHQKREIISYSYSYLMRAFAWAVNSCKRTLHPNSKNEPDHLQNHVFLRVSES